MSTARNHLEQHEQYHRGRISSLIGLVANLILSAIKTVAGIFGHSQALIADGIESLGDVLGSIVVWHGLEIASRPPDPEHPYGHGKAEPIAAALVAVLLVGAAFVIALESIHEILKPHQSPEPFTLVVLVGVVLVKEGLFRFVVRVGDTIGSGAVHTDAWHHRSDALTSAAAFVGIAVALIGGPGWETADDWAALFASTIIVSTGIRLLRPAVKELMDHSPAGELIGQVTSIAQARPGVHRVEKLLMRKMGLYFVADMHMEVKPTMTVWEGHEIAHDVKGAIQAALPQIVEITIHIEPAYPPPGVAAIHPKPAAGPARRKD